jgi:broad-specificity NMP kinase
MIILTGEPGIGKTRAAAGGRGTGVAVGQHGQAKTGLACA